MNSDKTQSCDRVHLINYINNNIWHLEPVHMRQDILGGQDISLRLPWLPG